MIDSAANGGPRTQAGLPVPPSEAVRRFGTQLELATRYAALLCTRGVERGLIGPREPARIWDRHLLNSVALVADIPSGAQVVDIGSGAGLPGIPVWLARPDLSMRLVEPLERRVRFLREVVAELALPIEVVHGRAEQQPAGSADVVIARAVAPLERLLPITMPILRPDGRLLALKGRSAPAEIATAGQMLHLWPGARLRWDSVGTGDAETVIVRVDRHATGDTDGAVSG
ncbi:MAG: rRNA (guanine527-N7)-methyltransferase [Frankiaceae bacterium]|nr:rRNA (guanine527-N7)-methyltransferase [Frankiaceae bacterium]